ncbi:MAG: TolC family protein [Taibaiella sp.]|jgi:outer membrane protein
MFKIYASVIAILISGAVQAQDSLWTLQRTIKYAVDNNLDIKQSVLNERLARLQLLQSQLSQLPNASVSGDIGRSYGRSIDPTTNQFINQGYTFSGLNGNVDVLLFGWFQKRNTISQNKFLSKAAIADVDQLKDNISLNVATAFLRILMAKEQIKVQENQLKFSLKQEEQTEYFVKAGRSPELDLAQMQAQVATDSSNYFTAVASYQQSLLDMKAIMNFEISAPYTAIAPDVNNIPLAELGTLDPEQVYLQAHDHFGSIRSSQLRIDAAQKSLAVSRGALYPQLSLAGQFGTNYSSTLKEVTGAQFIQYTPNGQIVDVNGTAYPVSEPSYFLATRTTPFGDQFSNNFRQTVALSLTVPLFSGWTSRTNVNRAKVDVQSKELTMQSTKLKLKQDVYKAYYDAKVAIQKYYAAARAEEASGRAYAYAQKRYELGLMNALELLTTQNNSLKATSDALSAKYDMLFKLKVIDYYLGKEIKL